MIVLAFAALLATVQRPSFDCGKASTVIERAICASPELAALDTQVAKAFRRLSGNAELMEQRLWLMRRSDRCPNATLTTGCLINLYQSRLDALENAEKTGANIDISNEPDRPDQPDPSYPSTTAEDLLVCHAVADATENLSLRRQASSPFLQKAFWRNGSADVGLGGDDEGTMHLSAPLVATKGVTKTLHNDFSKPDEGEPWAYAPRWFFYDGRPYIVEYPDSDDIYPEYVGALTDDLSERPLCRLSVKVDVRLTPNHPTDAQVCRVIWNGGGETIMAHSASPKPVEESNLVGGNTTIDKHVRVDAMNDGHPIDMYLYTDESGSGPGCDLAYYDTPPNDTSSPAHKAWATAQDLDSSPPDNHCAAAEPVWKRVAGKIYLLSQSDNARDPGNDRREFLTVDTVDHATPRRVCQGDFTRRTVTISDVWRGQGWEPAGK